VVGHDPPVVLDGAHNGASAEALAATLAEFAAGRPISLVIGINRDKDARAILRPLLRLAHSIWVTRAADNSRALEPDRLAALSRGHGADVHQATSVGDALREASARALGGGVVCVTGSLMLVGQARAMLGLPVPEHLW
jgi:dihydrofolate synthase/folylpolyglutamate synthase